MRAKDWPVVAQAVGQLEAGWPADLLTHEQNIALAKLLEHADGEQENELARLVRGLLVTE